MQEREDIFAVKSFFASLFEAASQGLPMGLDARRRLTGGFRRRSQLYEPRRGTAS